MAYCSFCDSEIKHEDFSIVISKKEDFYKMYYVFCSENCEKDMYLDPEGGEVIDAQRRVIEKKLKGA